MRWMNRLATALTALAVVAGPPLLAAAWLQRHPWHIPTRAALNRWAQQPLTAATIVTGCVCVAGLGWLLLVTYLARRAAGVIRYRLHHARRLPMPTPAQLTASSLAGVAALTFPAVPVGHLPAAPVAADTPQPAAPADGERHTAQPAGVALPGGGWIPYPTAAAITALAAATWLNRRRHYRPAPDRPRSHDSDLDLQPLPAVINTITTAAGQQQVALSEEPLSLEPPPPGNLRLTGPGAAAAARGLLVTAALTDSHPIRIDSRHLAALLPGTSPFELPTTVLTPSPRDQSGGPIQPGPDRDDTAVHTTPRVTQPAREAADAGTVILLDEQLTADHVWHISTDGTVTGPDLNAPRRLCILDERTAVDLLTLIRPKPANPPRTDPLPAPHPGPAAPTAPPGTATTARLNLLGECRFSAAGQPVHLRRTAGLQALVYLAVHPGGATRDELTHAIWPDLPAAAISQRLHTTLTDLRRQLRPLLRADPISHHDDRYLLNTDAISSDLQNWRTIRDRTQHAVGTAGRREACRDLLAGYRGELAAGRDWAWLIPAREQIRRTVIDACITLAHHAPPAEALTWLQQALTADPYNEAVHHQAAQLLEAIGDHSAAANLTQHYDDRLPGSPGRTS